MSGLHDAFAEIVAAVPTYGDLDRAIEDAERERLRRRGLVAGLVAAAAVLAIIGGVLAVTRGGDGPPQPVGPTPVPTPTKVQSPQTWVDTPLAATREGRGWEVPDPLQAARDAWLTVAAAHLDPGGRLRLRESWAWGAEFTLPNEGSIHPTDGRIGLIVDRSRPNLFDDGCGYFHAEHEGVDEGQESCSTERFAGPGGERVRRTDWGRRCGAWEGGGPAPATCGDYSVAVAVERADGRIGYVVATGRGTPAFNPFPPAAMAAAAADRRLTLPDQAYRVPSDQAVDSVVVDHFPRYRSNGPSSTPEHPGRAQSSGSLGRRGLSVEVWPSGGSPSCGRAWLLECVERRVYGAQDPTTVFVGAWDEEDWADCCPKDSRADSREFVYVGLRHTVVVAEFMVVRAEEPPLSADLDRRLIDLALDPRLQ